MLSTVAKAVSLALLVAASPVTNNATATVTGVGIANNATTTAAQPVANNATLPPPGPIPRATINSSNEQVTFHGVANQGYDEFLGIPFAEPPIGPLRFKPPVAKTWNTTDYNATSTGPQCLQYGSGDMSEDCLFLQVLTPPGASASHEKLPVMVWIYGGAFIFGSSSLYTSGPMIQYATSVDRPFILVTMNYRLDIFGFGYGRDVAENKAGNLGLRDQILALQWVQENIAAFGGDADKVTLFGQSAGAISTSLLMLNQTQDLFRGAIMHSGAQSTAPITNTSVGWNAPYNVTAVNAGCMAPNTTNMGTSTSTWDCLSRIPGEALLAASVAMKHMDIYSLPFTWAPSIDGDLIPDSPYTMLEQGIFARIPFITGNTKDEGTVFIPQGVNISTVPFSTAVGLLEPNPVDPSAVAALAEAYPNIPALGSPYDTGNETFGRDAYYKQLASLIGDVAFQSRRRHFLRQANKANFTQTWSYDFWGSPPDGADPSLGVAHSTDVPYFFGIVSTKSGYSAADEQLGRSVMSYWLNFAYYLDPNGEPHGSSAGNATAPQGGNCGKKATRTAWLPHSYPDNKNSLRLAPGAITLSQDDFREDQMKVLDGPEMAVQLNYKREVA